MNFSFARVWNNDGSITLNEVFGRKYDNADKLLKTIPRVYPAHEGYSKFSKLFQEGEVPVIRFHLSDEDFNSLINDDGNNTKTKYTGHLDILMSDGIFQFINTKLSLAGMSTRGHKKRPFKISLSDDKNDPKSNREIYNRSTFKLRNMVYDPSYIKNKLTVDIMTSLGIPVAQSSYTRFYIYDTPFGLYELTDVPSKQFVRNYFHTDEKKKDVKYGTLYKGCSVSNDDEYIQAFLYNDYPEYLTDLYQPTKVIREGAQESDDIMEFILWLDSLTDATTEKEITDKFDVEIFMKSMAVEYLTCQWDEYLQGGNNYYIYRNSNGFYTLFPFDFDITYGKWCHFENATFEEFCLPEKEHGNNGIVYSQLYNKILMREPFKSQIIEYIKNIVAEVFNIQTLGNRLEYLKEFLSDDIMWDIIKRQNLPTQSYPKIVEEPIPSFDDVMALLSEGQQTLDDYGVYNWIVHQSEKVALEDHIVFNIDNNEDEGEDEVGDPINDMEEINTVKRINNTNHNFNYNISYTIPKYVIKYSFFILSFIIYILF
ncbi:hypothetical protein PIROE2DRAFT_61907 [Piromyces sp. E2]|nr:hypothetical protein PIROE2DRAFT_61907 [Piromyces sp. E2]|eukprot:OUM62435.1 hypothetical protein PIROE2DRAFT_61907 [Piromyces sp. E2]